MDKPRFRIVEKRGVFRIEKEAYEKKRVAVDLECRKDGWFRRVETQKETYGYLPIRWDALGRKTKINSGEATEWAALNKPRYDIRYISFCHYSYEPYEFDSYDKAYKCLVKWEGKAVNLVEPEWRVA